MEDLRTALTADIESFARRVLSGSGTPQEVTALPSLLMWHSGVNPPQELPQERPYSLPDGGVVQVDGAFDTEPAVLVRESVRE